MPTWYKLIGPNAPLHGLEGQSAYRYMDPWGSESQLWRFLDPQRVLGTVMGDTFPNHDIDSYYRNTTFYHIKKVLRTLLGIFSPNPKRFGLRTAGPLEGQGAQLLFYFFDAGEGGMYRGLTARIRRACCTLNCCIASYQGLMKFLQVSKDFTAYMITLGDVLITIG